MATEAAPSTDAPRDPTKVFTVVETFSALGEKYEAAFNYVPAQVRAVDWLISQLASHNMPHARVLDVGSGTGKPTAEMLVRAGHNVHGIDITPRMVSVARAAVPAASFELADGNSWEPDASQAPFDAVTSFFALLTGCDQDDIKAFFPRAFSWIRPGGFFVFGTVPLEANNSPLNWMGMPILTSSLTEEQYVQRTKEAGFEVLAVDRADYMPEGEAAGICAQEEVWEEPHVFICARKPLE